MFKDNELTSIKIPEGVRTIGDGVFENNRFTELLIPESVISIGRNAFSYSVNAYGVYGNRNVIRKVTIGDNVELDLGAIRGFNIFYIGAAIKKGGTFTNNAHYWKPEDKSIPVYLRDNDLLTDITPLSELKKMKTLAIYNCLNIKNIRPFSSLINLESLSLTHNNNYDYTDISLLQKLENLYIYGDPSGEIDIISIGHLYYLKSLTLSNGFKAAIIKNINEFQNLTNLEELHIVGVANLDLSWAANLHNLINFDLDFCTVKDISPLKDTPNLVSVDLANNTIKDITSLIESNSIKRVRIYEDDVEMGINDNIRSQFNQKGIDLDTFQDTRNTHII